MAAPTPRSTETGIGTDTGIGTEITAPRPLGPVASVLDAVIRAYQYLFAGRVSPCRYVPSCSTYAREAIELHGAARGGWYALRRLGRCHPWGGHGYDPVPHRRVTQPPATGQRTN